MVAVVLADVIYKDDSGRGDSFDLDLLMDSIVQVFVRPKYLKQYDYLTLAAVFQSRLNENDEIFYTKFDVKSDRLNIFTTKGF